MDEITQEMYQLVKNKVREQAAYDLDAYSEVVDEVIDYYLEKGKLEDDDNLSFIKDQLMSMHESATDQLSDDE
jgi:polyhydroxyalkanoate synthesis regulator phasin